MFLEAYILGYPVVWSSGRDIVDYTITLGQNEKSSSCLLEIQDPLGLHCASLIRHTLTQGGIQGIEDPKPASAVNNAPGANPTAAVDVKTAPADMWVLAVISILEAPSDQGRIDVTQCIANRVGLNYGGYGKTIRDQAFASGQFQPFFTQISKGEIQDKETAITALGKKGYSRSQAESALNGFFRDLANPAMIKESQDKVAGRQNFKGVSEYGSKEGDDFLRTSGENYFHYCPNPGKCDISGFKTVPISTITTGVASVPQKEVTTKTEPGKAPVQSDTTQRALSPVKGNKLFLVLEGFTFEFYHQGTEHSDAGITKISGASVQWVLDRRKRTRTASETSLKAFATKVAAEHKLTLEWQSEYDPSYTRIDSNGLSDYKLLLRECNRCGLFISGKNNTLTIKSLKSGVKDTALVLKPNDMVSYAFKDEPLSSKSEKDSSKLQLEPKLKLDAVTGQIVQVKPDIDPTKSKAPTGDSKQKNEGKLKEEVKPVVEAAKGSVARLKGLPSTFTIPLTVQTLALEPMNVVRTLNFPDVLSRIWFIDTVTHKGSSGTTALNVYSPIEVLATAPVAATPGQPAAKDDKGIPGSGYIVPTKGIITGLFGEPRGGGTRLHGGTDIAWDEGTPVLATMDGVVASAGWISGYGQTVIINHPNGNESLYAHLSSYACKTGDNVKRGQKIGGQGNTGASFGTHLHFEINKQGGGKRFHPNDVGLPSLYKRNAEVQAGQTS